MTLRASHDGPLLDSASLVELDPRKPLVVVAPHPDDEVIGFGGAMFDHASAGGLVIVVAVTDGETFDPLASSAQRAASAAIRRDEQASALGVLGISTENLHRFGLPDGEVESRIDQLVAALGDLLSSLLGQVDPLIVAPWRADRHPDHDATNRAVRCALGDRKFLEMPIWSWRARREGPPGWSGLRVCPISGGARSAKRAALRCHHSQLVPLADGRPPILSDEFVADFDRPFEILCK
jgi:LmbE family N-acetylglucosaminyl deacetylase